MVLNAFILHKSQQSEDDKKKADYLFFIRDVAEGLISDHSRAGKQLIDAYKEAHPPRRAPAAQQDPQPPAAQLDPQPPDAQLDPQQPAAQPDPQPPAPTVWHNLEKIPPTKKQNPTKPCRECYRDKKRKEVRKHCVGCPDKPGLHDGDCFNKYHDRLRAELEAQDSPPEPIRHPARSPPVAPPQPIRPPARSPPVAPPQPSLLLARSPPLTQSRRGRRGGVQTTRTLRTHTEEVAGPSGLQPATEEVAGSSGLQPAPQASRVQIASRTSRASRAGIQKAP